MTGGRRFSSWLSWLVDLRVRLWENSKSGPPPVDEKARSQMSSLGYVPTANQHIADVWKKKGDV